MLPVQRNQPRSLLIRPAAPFGRLQLVFAAPLALNATVLVLQVAAEHAQVEANPPRLVLTVLQQLAPVLFAKFLTAATRRLVLQRDLVAALP